MGEFDLIARYFTRPVRHAVLGVGDDCALLAPRTGMQLAISSDMLVEGRHFFADVDPEALGHKALAVNLSDLAACGAKPLAFTLALSLPRWMRPGSQASRAGCWRWPMPTAASWWAATPRRARSTSASPCLARYPPARPCCAAAHSPATTSM